VLFYVLFVCKCVLPPGDNPTAVNKYIINKWVEMFWPTIKVLPYYSIYIPESTITTIIE